MDTTHSINSTQGTKPNRKDNPKSPKAHTAAFWIMLILLLLARKLIPELELTYYQIIIITLLFTIFVMVAQIINYIDEP